MKDIRSESEMDTIKRRWWIIKRKEKQKKKEWNRKLKRIETDTTDERRWWWETKIFRAQCHAYADYTHYWLQTYIYDRWKMHFVIRFISVPWRLLSNNNWEMKCFLFKSILFSWTSVIAIVTTKRYFVCASSSSFVVFFTFDEFKYFMKRNI